MNSIFLDLMYGNTFDSRTLSPKDTDFATGSFGDVVVGDANEVIFVSYGNLII